MLNITNLQIKTYREATRQDGCLVTMVLVTLMQRIMIFGMDHSSVSIKVLFARESLAAEAIDWLRTKVASLIQKSHINVRSKRDILLHHSHVCVRINRCLEAVVLQQLIIDLDRTKERSD